MDNLHDLKRSELQKLCKEYNLKASGKNTELIDRINEHLKESNNQENVTPSSNISKQKKDPLKKSKRNDLVQVVEDLSLDVPEINEISKEKQSNEEKLIIKADVDEKNEAKAELETNEIASVSIKAKSSDINAKKPIERSKENEYKINATPKRNTDKLFSTRTNFVSTKKMVAVKTMDIPEKKNQIKSIPNQKERPALKKKFDLKESLKKPLGWKPYTGPVKPLDAAKLA